MNALNTRNEHKSRLTLSLVVPVFNEEESINLFINEVIRVFSNEQLIDLDILFVNDGSTDDTLNQILACQKAHPMVSVVDLSRNFGKEAALTAGLNVAMGDLIVPIDVDCWRALKTDPFRGGIRIQN